MLRDQLLCQMFHAFTVQNARDLLQPVAQLSGHARMTSETEGSDVFNSAFTAAFDDRHNMVGRPRADKRIEPSRVARPSTPAENICAGRILLTVTAIHPIIFAILGAYPRQRQLNCHHFESVTEFRKG
jgi:hypothetical protein